MSDSNKTRAKASTVALAALVALVAVMIGGCASDCDALLAERGLRFAETVGDEYLVYVRDDASLDQPARDARVDYVESQRRLFQEALTDE